jgi:hypothetical protein
MLQNQKLLSSTGSSTIKDFIIIIVSIDIIMFQSNNSLKMHFFYYD